MKNTIFLAHSAYFEFFAFKHIFREVVGFFRWKRINP